MSKRLAPAVVASLAALVGAAPLCAATASAAPNRAAAARASLAEPPRQHATPPPTPSPTPAPVERLRAAALADDAAFMRLTFLCDRIGARLAGSPAYDRAMKWAETTFRADGQDAVRLEPAAVELWERGHERAVATAPFERELVMLGLGMSVGTPGLEAPVTVVRSIAEIGEQVRGRIVLVCPDVPPDASAGARYGLFAGPRFAAPSAAARHGALAVLIRSVPVHSLATPHTGTLHYDDDAPKIPGAALAAEDADWIARLVRAGFEVRVRLEMEAHSAGTVTSSNVIAEIRGGEKPDEIVLIGAHLDSWDVGQGAHDDGAGVIHVMETMRLIRSLGITPARTIRAVLFLNEEHGTDGGKAYVEAHKAERHVAALESDGGAGMPKSWGASGTPLELAWVLQAARATGLPVEQGGGGVDIGPLGKTGVLTIGLHPDTEYYFDIHHTHADTIDNVDPALLRQGVAALAVLTWQLANAPIPAAR